MRQIRILITIIAAAACGDLWTAPFDSHERAELNAARTRWSRSAPAAYQFEYRVSCFCPPALTAWHEVHVRGDSVVAVVALDSTLADPDNLPLSTWPTIPRLFDMIPQDAGSDYVKDISVSYDPALGYPTTISVQCKPNLLDCGSVSYVRNLRAEP